jgi:hypothetical protein
MATFLFNCLLTAALIGIPTVVLWLRSGRRRSVSESYNLAFAHLAKWFGRIFAGVAGLICVFALTDLLSLTHFGYPGWAVLICLAMIAAGVGISVLAAKYMRWQQRQI